MTCMGCFGVHTSSAAAIRCYDAYKTTDQYLTIPAHFVSCSPVDFGPPASYRAEMDRRRFLLTSLAGVFAAPLAAEAQQARKVARVGFLTSNGPTSTTTRNNLRAFTDRLRELGWTEGVNLVLESRYADWRYERLSMLADELVRMPVDVIFANAAPSAAAAKRATTSLPIVFETLGDPVAAGLVSSLAKPGGNLTGISGLSPELSGKRLQILKEAVPGLARVAILLNPSNVMTPPTIRESEKAAANLGLKLHIAEVRDPGQIESAFAALGSDHATAVIVVPDPMLLSQARRIQALLLKHRLPAIHNETGWLQEGALMLFGSSLQDHFRQAASLIDKILRGARPGDLPVDQSTRFELVINLKTAKALGLTIPRALLVRADHVIE
jgi:putative ABC transport system substrate-binding protein